MNSEIPPPSSSVIPTTDEQRWQAVVNRNRQADSAFVYAVRTTGVYCRPACPSRIANRSNVAFFDTPALAAAAGYRPCKRCRPDDLSPQQKRNALVIHACRAIEQSASALSLKQLAAQAGMSPHHFHRIFKTTTGVTPKAFYKSVQSRRVTASLQSAHSVTDAAFAAGFNSLGRFYEGIGAKLGMSPGSYRQGAAGEQIRYAIEPCTLGIILVAATRKGICAIEFGDAKETLLAHLRMRFPKAQFEPTDPEFNDWIAQVLRYIDQPHGILELPLDIQGTIFQRRVWQALQDIPAGQTASYAEIARRIGQPRAFRAVAHACASNGIAVAIPCHRIVRTNGNLSGYRWGIERKAELLRREKKS